MPPAEKDVTLFQIDACTDNTHRGIIGQANNAEKSLPSSAPLVFTDRNAFAIKFAIRQNDYRNRNTRRFCAI